MSAPTMTGILTHSYVTITFSEGCYNTNGGSGALEASDFALTYNDNADTGSSAAAITAISTITNTALAGGESSLRLHITTTGIPMGLATIEIKAATNSIWNAAGEVMADTQTTGILTLNAFKYIYVSKSGNDSNTGLVATLPKLTIGGGKAITATGENKIIIGVGTYTEVVAWDGSGKFITILGDYNAAIFGGSAGDIIIVSSNHMIPAYTRRYERVILSLTSSNKAFIEVDGTVYTASTHDLVYSYVTFRAYSGGSYINMTSSPYIYNSITFSNCSQDTGDITIIYGTNYSYKTNHIFDYFDNITAGKKMNVLGYLMKAIITNSTMLTNYPFVFNSSCDIYIYNSTIKFYTTNVYLCSTNNAKPINFYRWRNSIYIKDSSILDSDGSNLDITNYYRTIQIFLAWRADQGIDNIGVLGNTQRANANILLDNVNSNGKKILIIPSSAIIDGDTETYNSKDVLYYHDYHAYSKVISIIPLKGLSVSTQYDLTFDYKKAVDSSSDNYDIRFGVLKSSQIPSNDLYTTPANALAYSDYTSASHTYDTWYDDKTLTFTTTSDINDEYFLVFYMTSTYNNFKITTPVITLH